VLANVGHLLLCVPVPGAPREQQFLFIQASVECDNSRPLQRLAWFLVVLLLFFLIGVVGLTKKLHAAPLWPPVVAPSFSTGRSSSTFLRPHESQWTWRDDFKSGIRMSLVDIYRTNGDSGSSLEEARAGHDSDFKLDSEQPSQFQVRSPYQGSDLNPWAARARVGELEGSSLGPSSTPRAGCCLNITTLRRYWESVLMLQRLVSESPLVLCREVAEASASDGIDCQPAALPVSSSQVQKLN
jgi:hypothetical protein